MNKRTNRRIALLIPFALLSSFAFAGLPGSASAQTTSTPNRVVDFETISGSLNADGSLSQQPKLLDDLRVYGSGNVTVVDPESTDGLRNLLGYSGPVAQGGNSVKYTIDNLNGSKQFLTVANSTKQPPVAMSIAYTLNGQSIANGQDLVGKTGDVGISFTVENTTSTTQTVTYKDTQGNTLSSPQQVPLPMVAQLQVTLPPDVFTSVDAPGADVATDAFGNKLVNWSMVLVPPVGDVTQTVTLNAHADGFSLGPVQLAASPVAPRDRQYLDYAETQFTNAIQQSGSLYSGATGLADQLTQVNAGALKLIGGLTKLYKGAQKLAKGLQSAIAPSGTLMAGIGKLKGGLTGLIGGLNKVKAGVASGKGPLVSGVNQLQGGLATMQGCLTGDATGCYNPTDHSHNPSIQNISDQVSVGLQVCLSGQVKGTCALPTGSVSPFKAIANDIAQGNPFLSPGGINGCLSDTGGAASCYGGKSIDDLASDVGLTNGCAGDPTCLGGVTDLHAQITALKKAIQQDLDEMDTTISGLVQVFVSGYGSTPGALHGIDLIAQGLASGIGSDSSSAIAACAKNSANCTVRAGLGVLLQKVTDGFSQLLAGVGSSSPAAVNECLADSAKCTLLSGEGAVLNGIGQLQTGLQTGLGQAAAGAQTIATCIGAAGNQCQGGPSVKGGMSQLQQGVYAINELGVKEVARQANDTQGNIGAQLAVMKAEDVRAQKEALLYGPPSSDQAETVVGGSSVILTMDALDGRTSQTTSRGIFAGIALLLLVGLGLVGMRGMRRSAA